MDQSSPPPWRDCDPSVYQSLYPEFHVALQFRLLKLKPGSEKHPICCELTTASLSSPPVFHAISYAWGARKFDHQIKLHDCTIWTTHSVSQALRRVRGKWQSRLIWIDALCINQKDTAERSHQVRQMKQIFEAAKRVLVYLGIDQLPAATLPNALKQMIDCFKAFRWSTHWSHPNPDSIQLKGIPLADDGVWVAFCGALCQPWWQRVWIIQEAVVSRDLTFLIGEVDVPFDMLLQAYDACLTLSMPLFQTKHFTPKRQDQILHAGQILHAIDQRGAGRKFFAAADLIEILDTFRDLQASDPRDHCYALLGLSHEYKFPTLSPDYGKKVQLIMTQYATYMVEKGHGHKVFWSNYSPVLDGSLPSWVPDWSVNNFRNALLSFQLIRNERFDPNRLRSRKRQLLSNSFTVRAKGQEERLYMFDFETRPAMEVKDIAFRNGRVMALHALAYGFLTIAQVAPAPPCFEIKRLTRALLSSYGAQPSPTAETMLEAASIVLYTVKVAACLLPWTELQPTRIQLDRILACAETLYTQYTDSQRLPDAFCNIAAYLPKGDWLDGLYLNPKESLKEQMEQNQPIQVSLSDCVSEAYGLVVGTNSYPDHEPNIMLAAEFCRNKRLARLNNGELSQVCMGAQQGDEIWAPFGVNLPIVFRLSAERPELLQMIGEAHVSSREMRLQTAELVII